MGKKSAPKSDLESFRALLKVVQALQAEKDLDRLLELIISSITRVLRAERSTLFLYDAERNELCDKIAQESHINHIRLPMGKGIAGTVAATLTALNIRDTYNDPRFDSSWDAKTGFRTRNVLAMPLVTHEGKLIGVIEVLNKRRGAFTDADMEVLGAFSTNAAIAIDSAFLVRQYVEKQRIEHDMNIARNIQQGLLPRELPETDRLQLAAHLEPCEEASGDYYDVFPASNDELALVIADVTGHGIGPALIMSETRALFRATARLFSDPESILAEVNGHLVRDLNEGRFVTCCLVMLNVRTGRMRYANAGHDNAYLRRRRSGKWTRLSPSALPLGIMDEFALKPGKTMRLSRGDLLLLATDGFVESFDKTDRRMFGTERLLKAADSAADKHPARIVDAIRRKVRNFTGGRPQKDDQTLLVAKITAK